MNKIQEIKERLRIEEILARYWSSPDRNGRYKCVFHNGKDYNMGIVENACHCFVCNGGGDGLKVVQTIFGLTAKDAIKKLDEDFRLGLGAPLSKKEKQALAKKEEERKRERKRKDELEKFRQSCLDIIAEKLRVADEYLLNKQFKGEPNSAEMRKYSESLDFFMYQKAKERVRWLEWLWDLLTGDSHCIADDYFCSVYGTDSVEILRKIYKNEIKI